MKLTNRSRLINSLLAATVLLSAASAQQTAGTQQPRPIPALLSGHKVSPYHSTGLQPKARAFYQSKWGIEPVAVKEVSSGTMIKFTYRVYDAVKAKTLNDVKITPYLIEPKAHVRLVIPQMENVGQLRQTAPPENGNIYWMVFSNKGGYVKSGAHVDVVIGGFHANGLVVE